MTSLDTNAASEKLRANHASVDQVIDKIEAASLTTIAMLYNVSPSEHKKVDTFAYALYLLRKTRNTLRSLDVCLNRPDHAGFEQKLARVNDLIMEHGADAVLPKVNAEMKLRNCGSDAKLVELKRQVEIEVELMEWSVQQSFRNDAIRKEREK